MEETWELAALVMSEEEKKYERWDWSPKHTRLRYEAVISASVFFLTTQYSVVGFKFLPIELDKGVGPGEVTVVATAMVISAWFIMSFFIRSKNEISESAGVDIITKERLASIDKNMEQLNSSIGKMSYSNFENVRDSINHEVKKMRDLVDKFNLACDNKDLNWGGFFSVLDKYSDITSNIQTLENPNSSFKQKEAIEFRKNFIADLKLELKKIPDAMAFFDFSKMAKQILIDEKVVIKLDAATAELTSLQSLVSEALPVFQMRNLDVIKEQNRQILEFRETVSSRLNRPSALEKIWLAYRVPLFVAVTFFVVSVPFAIGKIFPSILNQKFCWCIL